jgi:hypothetical protein
MEKHSQPNTVDTKLVIYQTLITAQTSLEGIKLDTAFLKEQEGSINTAIKAYNIAEASFMLYATNGKGSLNDILPQIADVAREVTQVIATLVKPMDQHKVTELQAHAHINIAKPAISLKTIISYLQMAAEVATVIPGASAWAGLAGLVLSIVQKAIDAHDQASEIDLSKLHQLPMLS